MNKIFYITIGAVVIILIAIWIHFVAGVSSTYPPIKKYEYSGSLNQLITGIRNYTSTNPNVKFKITDTVGNKENGYALYLKIETKINQDSIEYGLKCGEHNSINSSGKVIISLVEAYNKTRNIGGYSQEAKGIEPLVNIFDTNFIITMKNSQNLKITPL